MSLTGGRYVYDKTIRQCTLRKSERKHGNIKRKHGREIVSIAKLRSRKL